MSLGSPVKDGVLRYVSPSAISSFDPNTPGGCEARWWFKVVAKRKEPERKAQKLGTQVHAQIEHYLRTGEDVLGELARAGLPFLPQPGKDLLLERGFADLVLAEPPTPRRGFEQFLVKSLLGGERVDSPLKAGGVPVIGFVDLCHRRDPVPEVVDWKTTSRIDDEFDPDTGIRSARGWKKTPEEIASSWQMIAYAKVALMRWPDAPGVALAHGYFQTRGPRHARKVVTAISVDQVEKRWEQAGAIARRMLHVVQEKDVAKVDKNYASCSAYGGCPHREVCPRSDARDLFEAMGGEGDMGALLDRLKSKAGEAAAAPALAAASAPTTPPAPAPAEVASAKELLLRTEGGGGILPPDATVPKPIAAPAPAAPTPGGPCPASGTTRELTAAESVGKKITCSCGETIKVKPRAMPDGKVVALLPAHGATPAPATAPIAAATTPEQTKYSDPTSGLRIYLDCLPDSETVGRLETYADQFAAEIAAEAGVKDIRCAQDGALSFGKWKGVLAAAVRAVPPLSGSYAVSSGNEIAMEVFHALESSARVVRGVR